MIEKVNSAPTHEIKPQLLDCCHSENWANAMISSRPYSDIDELRKRASEVWRQIDEKSKLEAIQAHPPIGSKPKNTENNAASWSRNEQSGVNQKNIEQLQELESYNQRYYEKFGYVFLICATGKTGDEMLRSLKSRITNDPDTEFELAVNELEKIIMIRLEKLLCQS